MTACFLQSSCVPMLLNDFAKQQRMFFKCLTVRLNHRRARRRCDQVIVNDACDSLLGSVFSGLCRPADSFSEQWLSCVFFFQECDSAKLQKDSPYMLFYEQGGLDERSFLPNFTGQTPDSASDDEEYENEVRRLCIVQ